MPVCSMGLELGHGMDIKPCTNMVDPTCSIEPQKACTMQMFIWQKDLFSVACYICACMKLHATLLEE